MPPRMCFVTSDSSSNGPIVEVPYHPSTSTYEEEMVATVPNENNSDKQFPTMGNKSTVTYLRQRAHICKIIGVQFTLLRSVTDYKNGKALDTLSGGSKFVLLSSRQHQRSWNERADLEKVEALHGRL